MMKPRLYEANTLTFTNNGFGSLIDAQECYAKQAFGAMELEMKYPVTGRLFHQLTYKRIILAEVEPLRDPQPFYIYRITKPMDGVVTVYGKQVCYQLDGCPVRPFTATTAPEAMKGLKSNAMTEHPFSFETNVASKGTFAVTKPTATWSLLGGTEGSVLDVFHGEYEFDQYTVRLLTHRGMDRGVTLRYGKNLQTLEQDANCAGCYTGVVAYWVNTKTEETVYTEPVLAEGTFGYSRILNVDFTDKFDSQPSISELEQIAATYIKDNDIGVPKVSLKVKFVPLEQTEELGHLALLERVRFGDTVHIFFPKLDIDVAARIVETIYDCLRGRYKEVTIGEPKQTLADLIVNQKKEIEKIPQGTALQIAMSLATQAIIGAKGGAARLLDTDGDGMPDTLYIADHPDLAQALKVWRFNHEGWGASKTGYTGPFTMAASFDTGILAEFITAGTLYGMLLKAGLIESADGKITIDLTSGKEPVFNTGIQTNGLKIVSDDADNPVKVFVMDTYEKDDSGKLHAQASFFNSDGKIMCRIAESFDAETYERLGCRLAVYAPVGAFEVDMESTNDGASAVFKNHGAARCIIQANDYHSGMYLLKADGTTVGGFDMENYSGETHLVLTHINGKAAGWKYNDDGTYTMIGM